MKIFILFLFVCVTCFCSWSQPKAVVDKATVKFEKITEGTILKHVFKITNEGTQPLILNSYNVGCPCTKVVLPKDPILKGQTVSIPMEFDSNGKYGLQDRVIIINTNLPKKELVLRFKVYIK